jgi:hypothetical protein
MRKKFREPSPVTLKVPLIVESVFVATDFHCGGFNVRFVHISR